jgi:cytochrome bd-type quinol oxidase subunit 2
MLPGMTMTPWLLALAFAIAAFPTFTMHSALRLAVRVSGTAQQHAKATARRAWWAVAGFTALIAMVGIGTQPQIVHNFATYSWGGIFPIMALAGLMGVRLWDSKETESLMCFASGAYILGMLTSAGFAAFPF